jgi:hypothetical protein
MEEVPWFALFKVFKIKIRLEWAIISLRFLVVRETDPALYADNAIHGARFRETVIDICAECLERHTALSLLLGTGNVCTTETTAALYANTVGTHGHCSLNSALHSAAKCDPALQLKSYIFSDELRG